MIKLCAFKKFLDDWENSVNGSADGNGGRGQVGGATGALQGQLDPRQSLLRENGSERALHQLIMGSYGADGSFTATRPRRNMLILGPPRPDKTSVALIPLALRHPGRVVSASIKDVVFRVAEITRSRMGSLWDYNPDDAKRYCQARSAALVTDPAVH
jgi:hypothetical protein